MPRRPMNACERGNWIDTEGHIESADEGRTYLLSVAQDEREPLEDYCAGATRDGVPCHIRPLPKIQAFRAEIRGVVNIAREIALTQKCIRTRKKQQQIQQFKNSLLRPRRQYIPKLKKTIPLEREAIRKARKILQQ